MAEKKKSQRRGHNEGSVYYDAERKRWVAEISYAPGKRKRYRFKTKQEAIRKKNEALRELEQNMLATGPQQKLGAYLAYWLDEVHGPTLRLSSRVKYEKLIRLYIVPELGEVVLQKLTPQHVQTLYRNMAKRGLATKTINSVHGVLHKALDDAIRWNLISRNVCDVVSPPRIVSREIVPLNVDQTRKLLEGVREHRLEVLLTVAVITGLRRGELVALRWSNIDFDRRTLQVLHTVDYIPKYGYVETEPKSKAGKRLVSLPIFLVEMLKQHRIQQLQQRLKVRNAWEDRDLVFPDLHGGYFNPAYLDRLFKQLLSKAGVPDNVRLHDLRHSAASILLSMGVNPKVVQELLGHSDISITLRVYGHVMPTMQEEAMGMWDDMFLGENKSDEKQG